MPITIQPQRIAFGFVQLGNQKVPVYVDDAWYRVLRALAGVAGSSTTTPPVDGGVSTPSVSVDDAIDLGYDDAASVRAIAMGLERAIGALEVESEVPALRAALLMLERRIVALESAP